MGGLVAKLRAIALRIDSTFVRVVDKDGGRRQEFPGDYVGLVLYGGFDRKIRLYSTRREKKLLEAVRVIDAGRVNGYLRSLDTSR